MVMRMVAMALLFGASAAGATAEAPRNPLFTGADPDIVAACGVWWIYPTDAVDGGERPPAATIYAWRSPDLVHWVRSIPALKIEDVNWIKDDGAADHRLWAPSMTVAGGKYYLYYSVGPQNPTPSRIGVAVGTRPEGPFVDSGRPLLTGGKGFEAIDPAVYIDEDTGKAYLYAGGSAGAKLRIFELASDMITIATEIPVETPPNFTEGAFVHKHDGIYYLSYSHGPWNGPDYSVHYATSRTPTGPWVYRGAILTADAKHQGPGHHAFVDDPSTQGLIIAYHRWERGPGQGPYKGRRVVAVDHASYGKDGSILPIRMTNGMPPEAMAPKKSCTGNSGSLTP
jgi:beta-xylosidase